MRRFIAIAGIAAAVFAAYQMTRGPSGSAPAAAAGARAEDGAGVPRMIELYTPWCPSCRSMKPVVDELAARCRDGGVRIDAVDISREDNERLAERLGIGAVPTFVFLDAAGAETARLVGAQSAETLRRELVEAGGAACGGSISG